MWFPRFFCFFYILSPGDGSPVINLFSCYSQISFSCCCVVRKQWTCGTVLWDGIKVTPAVTHHHSLIPLISHKATLRLDLKGFNVNEGQFGLQIHCIFKFKCEKCRWSKIQVRPFLEPLTRFEWWDISRSLNSMLMRSCLVCMSREWNLCHVFSHFFTRF